jgi:uncharacterized protein YlxP (DUF503 family)
MAFVCFIEIGLHFPENGSLKGKRKELQSLKVGLQKRFGAAVAETDHHDLWQRATVSVALVGRSQGGVDDSASALERFVHSRYPQGARVERRILSAEEIS